MKLDEFEPVSEGNEISLRNIFKESHSRQSVWQSKLPGPPLGITIWSPPAGKEALLPFGMAVTGCLASVSCAIGKSSRGHGASISCDASKAVCPQNQTGLQI